MVLKNINTHWWREVVKIIMGQNEKISSEDYKMWKEIDKILPALLSNTSRDFTLTTNNVPYLKIYL